MTPLNSSHQHKFYHYRIASRAEHRYSAQWYLITDVPDDLQRVTLLHAAFYGLSEDIHPCLSPPIKSTWTIQAYIRCGNQGMSTVFPRTQSFQRPRRSTPAATTRRSPRTLQVRISKSFTDLGHAWILGFMVPDTKA